MAPQTMTDNYEFRIFDFHIYNKVEEVESDSEHSDEGNPKFRKQKGYPQKTFAVQIFGKNTQGKSCSITVSDFKPFFYVKVGDNWGEREKNMFAAHLKKELGKYHENNIVRIKIVRHKKLYGFDAGKKNTFIQIRFENIQAMNKAKNLWYDDERRLLSDGYYISILGKPCKTEIYESFIPPLLRFFHILDMSPSGWIGLPRTKTACISEFEKTTHCDFEFEILYKDIVPLREKEDRVPLKIMSFDIEASSSHGDFPVPVKTYKKLATNVLDILTKLDDIHLEPDEIIRYAVLYGFGMLSNTNIEYDDDSDKEIIVKLFSTYVDIVYPKKTPTEKKVKSAIDNILSHMIEDVNHVQISAENTIMKSFEKAYGGDKEEWVDGADDDADDDAADDNADYEDSDTIDADDVPKKLVTSHASTVKRVTIKGSGAKTANKSNCTAIPDLIISSTISRDMKINHLTEVFGMYLPPVEGDKVTFIGSTFLTYGEKNPYYNHCVVLDTCADLGIENTDIESYKTEAEILIAWRDLVIRENPDIIIGYNIFGFDYNFMFLRAQETGCAAKFIELSKLKDHVCGTMNEETGKYDIEHSSITLASGTHDLGYIKMPGRIQLDLYNHFRREENLSSYKLDYVAGHFIGDFIGELQYAVTSDEKVTTVVSTKNMTGLLAGSYVHFEEIGHSTEYYDSGAKFLVKSIDQQANSFVVDGRISPDTTKKVRWALAKDDVTPKDIFNLTRGDAKDRAIVAKYCIQDCNLVQYLLNKVDAITGLVEMANICSVPISFLILRGQGIKLTSYVGKKCRENDMLMPDIPKKTNDGGYEGAIVLDPKSDLYLDNPVACVDYASLYPSSMISENLSHDSKVWTKEYNLAGKLVQVEGETDDNDEDVFIYDNMPGYEYVDVTYDTYEYLSPKPGAAKVKTKVGSKICRFAQFPNRKAIMPSILQELLKARKTTRKLIPQQTDDFMKNVLDKRQLAYKVTANSLYGQCGARTSTFYEKDIAASTTAIGRKLLTYAQRVVEEVYGDAVMDTMNYGKVHTKAEYVYGDSVAHYTPMYVKVDGVLDICSVSSLAEKYGTDAGWVECREEGRQEKEFCEMKNDVETWTENGWTRLHRVIRHKLASHKKMFRILTHTGLVDVTDDHSLLRKDGTEISPKDIQIGTECLHKTMEFEPDCTNKHIRNVSVEEARIYGFFFGDGSCGSYDCPSGKKSSWALNNANPVLLDKYYNLCKQVYPEYDWKIYNTIKSSGVNKISFNCQNHYGKKFEFIQKYRDEIYSGNSKKIPDFILNGSNEIRQSFWDGLYDADGDKDTLGYTRVDQKSQLSAAHICWLANSIGYKTSINTRKDKMDIYRITATKGKQRKCGDAVKKIDEIKDYTDYVYDLTTENHHFAAGVGNMIVHNTDSVFFTFNLENLDGTPIRGKKALEITIELAKKAGEMASKFLKKPHDLEYEKTFMPFCLLSKKRYVGMLYEEDPNKGKRKEMGIVLKRRDNAPIVKEIYGGIIDILMKERDIKKAVDFLQACIQNLVDEKYPMEKLIISKSIRSDYKNPQQIAHKVLADRMTARDPGNKPSSGDRIPYVYIHNPNRKALQGEKIETPTFITENNLKVDYSFYITNQVMKPVQQVFALVLEKIWQMQGKASKISRFKSDVKTLQRETAPDKFADKLEALKNKEVKALLFDKYITKTTNQKQGMREMTSFFGKI